MGNCLYVESSKPNTDNSGDERILRVVKKDGKILEYTKSIPVKDVLLDFDHCGIGLTQNASQLLPLNHELKVGQLYYLLPSVGEKESDEETPADGSVGGDGIKRIKVVITKQQLQQLMSKKLSMEEVLSGLQGCLWNDVDSETTWKPKLDTIPEGSELCAR
ncbi:uncharacterized protein [Aristolochia californica]|uniref:uncharacterized protein n=1 Tax=Aristolochia californica TaxID=171875 RepID=UPI0035D7C151